MMIVGVLFISGVVVFLFRFLLRQSKKPTGLVGRMMMRIWNRVYIPMTDWAINILPNSSYDRILDVGVGNGASSQLLKKRFPASLIYGIDLSEEAAAAADQLNTKGIHFSIQTIEQTSFQCGEFDLVSAFQTHFHWENLDQALLEIHRILTPAGLLLIACEYSKIQYFLKDIAKKERLEDYLNGLGFRLTDMRKGNNWVCYLIEKKTDNDRRINFSRLE
ncbi:class I SAM-dependent methyltransferase [Enterococcus sp. BWT-B8]|uniref:class I SAM-dependent methyltransferase n=1 Tax=Enterococcus sp. BWT-B8 TaxID=2885157 RepID=UPI001E488A64|nr:class I SAM-dependent methyltransferase [Enterococcus sp. BWT-B8]MCB5950748.1 class I SAM-dependent methyltransferase [Enterococcus sp. BWT-B8]